jgi:aryl-alcohol dehydrogenase-like predicted oxidoreductase
LTSTGGRRDAIRLLNEAYDLGITHFDTARLYGQGQSEALVGEFLRGKRHSVTVTTKVGLYPSTIAARFPSAFTIARRLKHALPRRKEKISPTPTEALRVRGNFDIGRVQASLETSLRELRTDYIDVLLLHECSVDDARNLALVEFGHRQIERGLVRTTGVGTAHCNLAGQVDALPSLYRVLQFELNLMQTEVPPICDRALVTHTVFGPLPAVIAAARANPALAAKGRAVCGIDLTDDRSVAAILLHHARLLNRKGTILFGTTQRKHLTQNLAALNEVVSEQQIVQFAMCFQELLRLFGAREQVQDFPIS